MARSVVCQASSGAGSVLSKTERCSLRLEETHAPMLGVNARQSGEDIGTKQMCRLTAGQDGSSNGRPRKRGCPPLFSHGQVLAGTCPVQ